MKIDYEKIDDVNGKVTITVEEKDYADDVKKELKKIGKTHAEPGFRAGHVPAGLIEKKYGKAVKYDTVSKSVGEALFKYIEENHLPVLGNPIPDKGNNIDPEKNEYTLIFKLGLAPKMDVKADKDMKIPYYKIEVSDEMVNRQDEHLRQRFGKQVPGEEVDATALVKGVITELNEDGTVKEGGLVVENGILAPQYFKSEEQRKLFIGKKVGDEVVFNPWATCEGNPAEMSSMLNIDKNVVDEYKGDFRMDIKEIIVLKLAELGEEFYNEVFGQGNVKDEKQYREAVKKMISDSLAADENYRFSIDAKDVITEAVKDTKLPDDVLKEYLLMQHDSVTPENVDEVYAGMRGQLVWDLAKEAIAEQLDIKVTDEDLKNTARIMARQQFAQYGMTNVPEDAVDRFADDILKDKKAIDSIRTRTADMKLFNGLKATVTIEEKNVTPEQFNALFATEENAETEA